MLSLASVVRLLILSLSFLLPAFGIAWPYRVALSIFAGFIFFLRVNLISILLGSVAMTTLVPTASATRFCLVLARLSLTTTASFIFATTLCGLCQIGGLVYFALDRHSLC